MTRKTRFSSGVIGALLLLLAPASAGVAHEVPADVIVQAFLRAHEGRLRLLVRVPLEAMRDFDFPLQGPGYLAIEGAEPMLREAALLWVGGYVRLFEDGAELPPLALSSVRVSAPSDRSFTDYDRALAHLSAATLPPSVQLPWQQALLDMEFEVPLSHMDSPLAIETEWGHLGVRTQTVLRFVTSEGAVRAFQFTGNPGRVAMDPRWLQAATRFVKDGFLHILGGLDHVLFLLCLVVPFRRTLALIPVVTAFTLAHSLTLIASALGVVPSALWFPPLVEMLIAVSIVVMALENVVGAKLGRRWGIAFGFGLVHGFGFSFALGESLQFAGSHLITSLLAFNVGVELGQLAVLMLMVPVLNLAFKRVLPERWGVIVLSALVAHSAWHWTTERWAILRQYAIELPAFDLAFWASATRWLILALIAGTAAWGLRAAMVWLDARGRVDQPTAEDSDGPEAVAV